MMRIIFIGWQVGMRPIPFIKLLSEKAKLSLVESKRIKERIINNDEPVEITIEEDDIAKEIFIESQKLGVKCELYME